MTPKSILTFILSFFCFQAILFSSPVINTEDHPEACIGMNEVMPESVMTSFELKKLQKEESKLLMIGKRLDRLQKIFLEKSEKRIGGFKDPVDRWFWIWTGSWGLGLLLTLILGGSASGATLGLIWLAAFGLGSIALILWLVKRFR